MRNYFNNMPQNTTLNHLFVTESIESSKKLKNKMQKCAQIKHKKEKSLQHDLNIIAFPDII